MPGRAVLEGVSSAVADTRTPWSVLTWIGWNGRVGWARQSGPTPRRWSGQGHWTPLSAQSLAKAPVQTSSAVWNPSEITLATPSM